jgi:23S rRNA (uracil747-C5)-methyltransferase
VSFYDHLGYLPNMDKILFDSKKANLAKLFSDFNELKLQPGHESHYYGSRNKAKFSLSPDYQFGVYDSELNFKSNENDLAHTERINQLLPVLRELFKKYQISVYDTQTKKGELKRVIISDFEEGGILRFVLRSMADVALIEKMFRKEMPNSELLSHFKVRSLNIQPEHSAKLTGDREIIISEDKFLAVKVGDVILYPGPESFFQTNTLIASKLYQSVKDIVKNIAPQKVLDLFCGTGGFALHSAPFAKQVIGIEITEEAIIGAKKSLEQLAYNHVEFMAFDLDKNQTDKLEADLVIVNPPRRGLGTKVINDLLTIMPEHIIYSSCNPETLRSDTDILKEKYDLLSLEAFDMFPETNHLEALAHFVKKQS